MEREFEQEYKMIGLKIAYYRKLQGYTQEKLAEKLEVATSYIGQIEALGMYKPISLTTRSGAGRASLQVSTVRLRDTPSASPMARQMGCFGN